MTNEEKYKTADERSSAFKRFCDNMHKKHISGPCPSCPAFGSQCAFRWLTLEAEEELLACPFCGSTDIKVIQAIASGYVATCNDCWAASRAEITKDDAIAAWNRRVK